MMLADLKPRVIRLMGEDRWSENKPGRPDFGVIARKRRRGNPAPNLVGQKVWNWTVVSCAGYDNHLEVMKWNCVCVCGKTQKIATGQLRHGRSKSCGCMRGKRGAR